MANRLFDTQPLLRRNANGALSVYLQALRAHRAVVAISIVAALAGSLAFRAVATPRYEATAQLLVTPVPADDPSFLGLPVLRQTPGDPVRTIETATALLDTTSAATRAATALRPRMSTRDVLSAVSLEPQGQSNVIAVTATADTGARAAAIANAYARATLVERAATLRSAVIAQIPRLEAQLKATSGTPTPNRDELTQRLGVLRSLIEGGDPSLSLSQPARAPGGSAGPALGVVLFVAALVGFIIGSIAAVLREMLARALRDEDEVVAMYPLPVLARVPVVDRRRARGMSGPTWDAPPAVREAFRTLLAQLKHTEAGRVVMIASASARDGKTTSAINLAAAIAQSGERIILLDCDLRKPDMARALGLTTGVPLSTLAKPDLDLSEVLVPALQIDTLSVLPTRIDRSDDAFLEGAKRRLPRLIEDARSLAEWVVVDTAPLGLVSDALAILRDVDDIVVVVRPGVTDRSNFESMHQLLDRTSDRSPAGLLVISRRASSRRLYGYGYGYRARDATASGSLMH